MPKKTTKKAQIQKEVFVTFNPLKISKKKHQKGTVYRASKEMANSCNRLLEEHRQAHLGTLLIGK